MSAMRVVVCAGLATLAIAGQAASAQQAGFATMPGAQDSRIAFVDVGSLKRNGMDVEGRVLDVSPAPLGQEQPVTAMMNTWRVSCDWNSVGFIEFQMVGADGEVLARKDMGGAMNFARAGMWPQIVQIFCNPQDLAQAPHFASLKEALTEAERVTVRRYAVEVRPSPPKEITGPVVIANHPDPKRKQYGAVRIEPATGNALYLDWANITKKDGKLQAITLELLGDHPTETQYSLMKVNSVELDCKARTVQVLGYTSWGGSFTERRQVDEAGPLRAEAGWPLGGELLGEACNGRKPKKTFSTELDVSKFVEQSRTKGGG